eukprot:CAMPEP_0118859630 /NCGR_PEP_ID=MMETSP1163-20130328/5800_1 /TAXON_ID=124430 /ORGANISM="Phaeomonas parva, Strain CCMP2877" /LENGTH=81 /DNA_ID=CAMNT_0006793249 /DNA_START=81 /DNA_END=322 /DNA_ORIENTATION=+
MAVAFTPAPAKRTSTALYNGLGAGGMADTRDPDSFDHDDPRMSISRAPTFEEYMKKSQGGGASAAAPAPAPAAAPAWGSPA